MTFNFPMLADNAPIDLSEYTNREKIEILEYIMLNSTHNIADELPVMESVRDGWYIRQLSIPEGVILTGKVHTEPHICLLSQGDLSVMTDDGIKRIQAPYIFVSSAQLKKIGYAHKYCVFTTLHQTELTDLDEINTYLFKDSDLSWVDNKFKELICQQ